MEKETESSKQLGIYLSFLIVEAHWLIEAQAVRIVEEKNRTERTNTAQDLPGQRKKVDS